MKIIAKDNFAREHVSDVLIEENISEKEGKEKVDCLNAESGDNNQWWYELVPDNYKLYKFDPNA